MLTEKRGRQRATTAAMAFDRLFQRWRPEAALMPRPAAGTAENTAANLLAEGARFRQHRHDDMVLVWRAPRAPV